MTKKPEREIIVTYSDKTVPTDFPVRFVEFVLEMGRVRAAKEEERKRQEQEATQ